MSRRKGEFEHRTSIFEGAYRAWSYLGRLEPEILFQSSAKDLLDKQPELDPLVIGDKTKNKIVDSDSNGRPEIPHEPLPRNGLDHPWVFAILPCWLGSDASNKDLDQGLSTFRNWWQHRKNGETGSAIAALETMKHVVDRYYRHFFKLAHQMVVHNFEAGPKSLAGKIKDIQKAQKKKLNEEKKIRKIESKLPKEEDEQTRNPFHTRPYSPYGKLQITPPLASLFQTHQMHVEAMKTAGVPPGGVQKAQAQAPSNIGIPPPPRPLHAPPGFVQVNLGVSGAHPNFIRAPLGFGHAPPGFSSPPLQVNPSAVTAARALLSVPEAINGQSKISTNIARAPASGVTAAACGSPPLGKDAEARTSVPPVPAKVAQVPPSITPARVSTPQAPASVIPTSSSPGGASEGSLTKNERTTGTRSILKHPPDADTAMAVNALLMAAGQSCTCPTNSDFDSNYSSICDLIDTDEVRSDALKNRLTGWLWRIKETKCDIHKVRVEKLLSHITLTAQNSKQSTTWTKQLATLLSAREEDIALSITQHSNRTESKTSDSVGAYESRDSSCESSEHDSGSASESDETNGDEVSNTSPDDIELDEISDKDWVEKFCEFGAYMRGHGDDLCRNPSLRNWATAQRTQYHLKDHGTLSRPQIRALDGIRFQWGRRKCQGRRQGNLNRWKETWFTRYNELKEYREEKGNCLVPFKYGINPKLGQWVATQRKEFKKEDRGLLTEERIRMLDEIDFEWCARPTDNAEEWMQHYRDLELFKRAYGHCLVPPAYEANPGLARWVSSLRSQFNRKNHGSISNEQIRALNVLGFQWYKQKYQGGALANDKSRWSEQWNARYNELVEYKRVNGDCMVPFKYPANPRLGQWVATQRSRYKMEHHGFLSEDRIRLLNDIGFVWSGKGGRKRVQLPTPPTSDTDPAADTAPVVILPHTSTAPAVVAPAQVAKAAPATADSEKEGAKRPALDFIRVRMMKKQRVDTTPTTTSPRKLKSPTILATKKPSEEDEEKTDSK